MSIIVFQAIPHTFYRVRPFTSQSFDSFYQFNVDLIHTQEYIHDIASDRRKSEFVKVRNICRTIAGNGVPVLTITSPVKSQTESKAKRAVVLTARVHPGETNGSWMMKGFLDFITGKSPDAKVCLSLLD